MKSAPAFCGHGKASPVSHMPEKSGLPSAVRGAAAARFGLPSANRGTPAVGYFSHCADRAVDSIMQTVATSANTADDIRRRGILSPLRPLDFTALTAELAAPALLIR